VVSRQKSAGAALAGAGREDGPARYDLRVVPELPDIALYLHALGPRVLNRRLDRVRVASPFLVRSLDPPVSALEGRIVRSLERMGKRVVWEFEGDLFCVIHLMVAGRFRWRDAGASVPGRIGLAAFDFESGSLLLTEAGSKKRASLQVVGGRQALAALDPGGLDPLTINPDAFAARLRAENHTLKRSLTDPRVFSGIGNAYSDEILHAAQLSPLQLTSRLADGQMLTLYGATRSTLSSWVTRLIAEAGDAFPEHVSAFREGMAVHGRYGQPCPRCGAPVQRITYAQNECNYCAACQTGGRLLADRALSRLLKEDWPRTLEELDTLRQRRSN
jgi:formamidopyrimidine-DNA glycosylase